MEPEKKQNKTEKNSATDDRDLFPMEVIESIMKSRLPAGSEVTKEAVFILNKMATDFIMDLTKKTVENAKDGNDITPENVHAAIQDMTGKSSTLSFLKDD